MLSPIYFDFFLSILKDFLFLSFFFLNNKNNNSFFLPDCSGYTTASIILSQSVDRLPCVVPNLRGKALSFSLLSMMLAVGLLHLPFD